MTALMTVSCHDELADKKVDYSADKGSLKSFTVAFDSPTTYGVVGSMKTRLSENGEITETEFVEQNELTRTSEAAEKVKDVWVLQYDNVTTHLLHAEFRRIDTSLDQACTSIMLDTATISSDVYFLVNTGDSILFSRYGGEPYTAEQLENFRAPVQSESWVDSIGVPMYGVAKNIDFVNDRHAYDKVANVSLKRIVAKLTVELYIQENLDIQTVTLCGVPATYSLVESDTTKEEVRGTMDFDVHNWTDEVPEEKIYNSARYKVRTFIWYIPGYNPATLADRAYVKCKGNHANQRYECKFRLYGADRDPQILANQEYKVTDILSTIRECGDESSDAYLELLSASSAVNMAINEKGEEEGANCYVANTEGNTRLEFTFPVIQYERYVEAFGSEDYAESLQDNRAWEPEILWKTNTDNVDTEISEYTGYGVGYINVKVKPKNSDPQKCFSNVLVGLREKSSGNILWSWHIWVTPIDILADTIRFNGTAMLGYHLGASKSVIVRPPSEEMTDAEYDEYLANYLPDQTEWGNTLGLYYQWGRKDPFLGFKGDITTGEYASTHFGANRPPNESDKGVYTIEYEYNTTAGKRQTTIKNPTLFLLPHKVNNNTTYSWEGSNDNVSWNTRADGTGGKTIFDPCPPGFRVMPLHTNLVGTNTSVDYINNTATAVRMGWVPYQYWMNGSNYMSVSNFSSTLRPYAWYKFKAPELKGYSICFPACGYLHFNGYFEYVGWYIFHAFSAFSNSVQRVRGHVPNATQFSFISTAAGGTGAASKATAFTVIAVKDDYK